MHRQKLASLWRRQALDLYIRRALAHVPGATLGFLVGWPPESKLCYTFCTGRGQVWRNVLNVLERYGTAIDAFAIDYDAIAARVFERHIEPLHDISTLFLDRHHPTSVDHEAIGGMLAVELVRRVRGGVTAREVHPASEPTRMRALQLAHLELGEWDADLGLTGKDLADRLSHAKSSLHLQPSVSP